LNLHQLRIVLAKRFHREAIFERESVRTEGRLFPAWEYYSFTALLL
jgi:hypothetical protein